MSQANAGDTVKVHFIGKLPDGSVFGTSQGGDPLQFTLGAGQVIPGLDNAVVGMSRGESKSVVIPVDEAYGRWREEMVVNIDRRKAPSDLEPKVGQQLKLKRNSDGEAMLATVIAVSEASITLDANHPLADKELSFELELLEIL
jgi:FKBP-type peptidyl-prolyl cis-trans isomerase 2